MTPSMRDATELYDAAASLEIARVCVEDEGLWTFSRAVRDLKNRLGEEAADSYWRPVLARLRRVSRELATVPLPFDHPAFELEESAAFVSDRLRNCDRVFPAHAAAAQETSGLLADLSRRDEDPLGAAVRSLPLDGRSAFPQTQSWFRNGRNTPYPQSSTTLAPSAARSSPPVAASCGGSSSGRRSLPRCRTGIPRHRPTPSVVSAQTGLRKRLSHRARAFARRHVRARQAERAAEVLEIPNLPGAPRT